MAGLSAAEVQVLQALGDAARCNSMRAVSNTKRKTS
jgi:hypothetical protein